MYIKHHLLKDLVGFTPLRKETKSAFSYVRIFPSVWSNF